MAAPEAMPHAHKTELLQPTLWLWKWMLPDPTQLDPMAAPSRTSSRPCEENVLDVEQEATVAKIAPGPTPLAPSAAAKATMIKSAETDLWATSEAVALLPGAKGWPPP